MPTEGQIRGTIGWLRAHRRYDRDALDLCDAYEEMREKSVERGNDVIRLGREVVELRAKLKEASGD